MSYRIKSIHIEAFQGINKPITIDLEGKNCIITGPNGVGKTSIVRAIEFALYGTIKEMRGSEFSRVRDEINNNFSSQDYALVGLTLQDEKNTIYFERTKEEGTKVTDIQNMEFNGKKISKGLDKELAKIRNMTDEEFHLLVYLTQENFQQLIEYRPTDRSKAFSMLLKIDPLKKVVTAYTNLIKLYRDKNSSLDREIEDLDELIAEFDGLITEKTRELNKRLDEYRAVYRNFDANNPALIIQRLEVLHDDVPQDPTFVELETYLRAKIKGIGESENNSTNSLSRLFEFKNQMGNLKPVVNKLLDAYRQYRNKINEYGTIEELESKLSEKRKKLQLATTKLDDANKFSTFLSTAMEVISTDMKNCPLCEKPDFEVSHIKASLTNKFDRLQDDEINEINEQKEFLEGEIETLEGTIADINDLKSLIEQSKDLLNEKITEIHATSHEDQVLTMVPDIPVSPLSITTIQDFQQVLEDTLTEIEKLIETRQKEDSGTNKAQIISQLSSIKDEIGDILNVKAIREEINDLVRKKKTRVEKRTDLLNERKINSNLMESLQKTQDILIDNQHAYIKDHLETLNPQIKRIYGILHSHPVWSQMGIELSTQKYRGTKKTTFDLETRSPNNGDSVNVKAYFSKGQMNRSVLALLLAIGSKTAKSLNFQLLDDITQSLDGGITNRLAIVCSEISREQQVIIATSDERFVSSLHKEFTKYEIPYTELRLKDWNADGVKITIN